MSKSYYRKCKKCERPIQMRRMPHGQWVAFEGYDTVHDCKKPPRNNGKLKSSLPSKPSKNVELKPYLDIGLPDVSLGSSIIQKESQTDKQISDKSPFDHELSKTIEQPFPESETTLSKQFSISTERSDPREVAPQLQHKSRSPIKDKRDEGISPGKSALIALSLLIIIPFCIYIFFNALSAPSAAINNQSKISSRSPTFKHSPTPHPPTITPEPQIVTPIPSSIPLPYSESFTIDRGLWYVGDDEEAIFSISNGQYLIQPKKPGGIAWASLNTNLDDVVIGFTTRFNYIYPSKDGGFFLNFRCENSDYINCYSLRVNEDGYIMVYQNETILVDRGYSNHINLYDHPNEWFIVMDGSKFEIHCNNEFLLKFSSNKYQRGDFGFGVINSEGDEWGYHGITIDDIRVSKLSQ